MSEDLRAWAERNGISIGPDDDLSGIARLKQMAEDLERWKVGAAERHSEIRTMAWASLSGT